MDATYIQQSMEQFKKNIFDHVHHRTLLQYTGSPEIHVNQLFYLLLPFLNGEKWDEQIQKSAITVGIVHASLNEHDKINEKNATSKSRQLTVLSGDYYSGRYYEILAKLGNIPLIRQLSEGIVIRCEHQIKVYENNDYKIDDWFEVISVIQTELINRFYQVYQYEQYSRYMHTGLLLLQLQEEIRQYRDGHQSIILNKMIECATNDGKSIEELLTTKIEELKSLLYEYLQSSSVLQDDLKLYIKQQIAFR